jgi:hypothetical protein
VHPEFRYRIQIKSSGAEWILLHHQALPKTDYFGVPSGPVAVDSSAIIFGCQDRLCTYNKSDKTINLISNGSVKDAKSATWITLNKVKFALVASDGKLALFRKP